MSRKKKMIFLTLGIVLIVAAAAGVWLFFFSRRANPELPTETLRVDNATFVVEIASTTLQKMTGLSFRTSLAPDRGMLFLFGTSSVQNIRMQDMNFPLDMIWIGGNTVRGVAHNAIPQPGDPLWRLTIYSSPSGTDKVLEVNAGIAAQYGIQAGDTVEIAQ